VATQMDVLVAAELFAKQGRPRLNPSCISKLKWIYHDFMTEYLLKTIGLGLGLEVYLEKYWGNPYQPKK
jgi:hypothetical protein